MGKLSVFWKLIIGEIITLSVLWKCGQRLFKELIIYRAWVSMGAKGAWYPLNFWTVMSGTRWFWQFYYILLSCTHDFWEFTSDWRLLFQIPNSSPVMIEADCSCAQHTWHIGRNQRFDRERHWAEIVDIGQIFVISI